MKRLSLSLATFALFGLSTAALAHTGHGVHGFGAGLGHPFTGLDHLLAMFAVGLWAAQAQRERRRVWLLPVAFMLALAGGAALAMNALTLPWVEQGIATSVLALGLLIALAVRLPAALSILLTATFGLAHGYAHGLEMPLAASPVLYGTGFLLATALLHLSGVGLGLAARQGIIARIAGALIAVTGAGMLAAF
jgi:urease accessory protein